MQVRKKKAGCEDEESGREDRNIKAARQSIGNVLKLKKELSTRCYVYMLIIMIIIITLI
jgi:hypothetical protein